MPYARSGRMRTTARCSRTIAAPDDEAVEELIALYRSLVGEHNDWDDYRAAMVGEQRAVVRIRPDRAYGMLPTS